MRFLTIVTPAMVALGWVSPQFLSSQNLRSPFTDGTVASGIEFQHQRGASDQKHLVETVGSGCALFDYDNDGWLDILMINGGLTPDSAAAGPVRHGLYRNLANGRFQEVTARAGLGGNGAFGMGVAVGDYDNDGDRDVYVTNFGPNGLYRNNGDGTFSDVTGKAGVGCSDWSTSAAFFDMENDGDLDLYVTNYVDTSFETNPLCELKNIRTYCYPGNYDGVADRLYQNLGGGRFRDVSAASGILNAEGKGLGVVAADFDDDGWTDLYVANDTVRNFHYRNNRQGGFEDMTLLSGTGYNEEANPEAGMGTDAADYDGDGLMDIVVTNYDMETNALYRNHQDWLFTDERASSGVTRGDQFLLGFGTGFFDFDNDGDQDLLVGQWTRPRQRRASPVRLSLRPTRHAAGEPAGEVQGARGLLPGGRAGAAGGPRFLLWRPGQRRRSGYPGQQLRRAAPSPAEPGGEQAELDSAEPDRFPEQPGRGGSQDRGDDCRRPANRPGDGRRGVSGGQ